MKKVIIIAASLVLCAGLVFFTLSYARKNKAPDGPRPLVEEKAETKNEEKIQETSGDKNNENTEEENSVPTKEDEEQKKETKKDGAESSGKADANQTSGVCEKVNTEILKSSDSKRQKIADEISKSVEVKKDKNGFRCSYTQPAIEEQYHVSVKITSYTKEGATVERYVSDAGWLSDPKKYDPSAGLREIELKAAAGGSVVVEIRVNNAALSEEPAVYMISYESAN